MDVAPADTHQGSIQFLHVLGVEVHIGRASTPELRGSC
jgi:hypothetical protein